MRKIHVLALACVAAFGLPSASAQQAADPTPPESAAPTAPATTAPAKPAAGEPVLPPLATQPDLVGPPGGLSTRPSVNVRRFAFAGNRRISDAELANVVAKYVDRPLAIEDLEQARVDLTQYLVDKGYINSGAVLPDQTVPQDGPDAGVVTFEIVEGRLSEVRVTGTKFLRPRFVAGRLERAGRSPLDIVSVKDQLELVRQNPNVRSINAELRPGAAPGDGILDVVVKERLAELPPDYLQSAPFFRRLEVVEVPLSLSAQYSNRRPPSVGSTAVDLLFTDTDLTGFGDTLFVRYDVANGKPGDLDLAGTDDFSIDYTLPFTAADTTLNFNFTRTDSVVVETPFRDLNINSVSNSYALTLRQPVYRRPTVETDPQTGRVRPAVEVAVFGTFAYREDSTSLLGRPFEFSPGTSNGRSKVWVVRAGQEFTSRTTEDALSVRSTFSLGLPIFDATENRHRLPDGQFFACLLQAQYVRRLGPAFRLGPVDLSDAQVVLRGAGQYASSPLLPTEQFAVGGFDTVRGYRENFLVRDRGVVGSVELRVPVLSTRTGESVLTAVPFVDVGYASDLRRFPPDSPNRGANLGNTDISSVGLGLIYTPDPHVTAQLFYGYALQSRTDTHQDIQDVGIHFSLTLTAF